MLIGQSVLFNAKLPFIWRSNKSSTIFTRHKRRKNESDGRKVSRVHATHNTNANRWRIETKAIRPKTCSHKRLRIRTEKYKKKNKINAGNEICVFPFHLNITFWQFDVQTVLVTIVIVNTLCVCVRCTRCQPTHLNAEAKTLWFAKTRITRTEYIYDECTFVGRVVRLLHQWVIVMCARSFDRS